MIFLAAIAFGPLEPARQQSFDDGIVRAHVTYRIAHDRTHDTGPTAVSPSIASGSLTLSVAGKTRTIDLASLFPIHENRIDFAEPGPPYQGCGVGETLSRRGDYLAIQAIVAQKGCAPVAAFVEISSGQRVEPVVLDHAATYRYDARPVHFIGTSLVVRKIDRLSLRTGSAEPLGHAIGKWPFVIVHAVGIGDTTHVFAFDARSNLPSIPESAMDDLPTIGSRVSIGNVVGRDRPFQALRFLAGERLVRLDTADEARYTSRLPPPPPGQERALRREGWDMAAADDARASHFNDAVRDLIMMLSFEDDPGLYRSESATLEACKHVQARVRAGLTTEADASATFEYGCQMKMTVPFIRQ
jgi:hypothetical protein